MCARGLILQLVASQRVGVGEEAARELGGVLAADDESEDVVPRSDGCAGEDQNEDLD